MELTFNLPGFALLPPGHDGSSRSRETAFLLGLTDGRSSGNVVLPFLLLLLQLLLLFTQMCPFLLSCLSCLLQRCLLTPGTPHDTAALVFYRGLEQHGDGLPVAHAVAPGSSFSRSSAAPLSTVTPVRATSPPSVLLHSRRRGSFSFTGVCFRRFCSGKEKKSAEISTSCSRSRCLSFLTT